MAEEKNYDVDGFDVLTSAIRELINTYPALTDEITFSVLKEDSGKAMFPMGGAVIMSERVSITEHVTQDCIYPFTVVYRASGLSENNKAKIKEWLDNLGAWLERQPITIKDKEYQLEGYPKLTGTRKIKRIARTSPSYLAQTGGNMAEDWAITVQVIYKNEFDRL